MPIHDWTRVDHGTFHHFHVAWSVALYDALNEVLPPDYYAMVEQHAPPGKPDVLALRVAAGSPPGSGGGTSLRTVAVAPPRVHHRSRAADDYVADRKTVTVRHRSGGEIVALIEVASPGNKSSRHGLREFVDKVTAAIGRGLHVMVIDLFPPGPRDPNGFHPLIWSEFREEAYDQPTDRPLTVASYSAGAVPEAFVEPVAVGDPLPAMPLFLEPGAYVEAPLERSYTGTWNRLPPPLKALLAG